MLPIYLSHYGTESSSSIPLPVESPRKFSAIDNLDFDSHDDELLRNYTSARKIRRTSSVSAIWSDIDQMFPSAIACSPEYSFKPPMQDKLLNRIPDFRLKRINQGEVTTEIAENNKIKLNLINCEVDDIRQPWSETEQIQNRKIVRFTKSLDCDSNSSFTLLNLKADIVNMTGIDFSEDQYGVDPVTGLQFIEISCIRCKYQPDDLNKSSFYEYYITSVEIIKLIQFIIGTITIKNDQLLRTERGRLRSNLLPFWSNWTIKSRNNSITNQFDSVDELKSDSPSQLIFDCDINEDINLLNTSKDQSIRKLSTSSSSSQINESYRAQLSDIITDYKFRRPRGFEKDVRVLAWDKLEPALNRVLQNYYYIPT